MSIIIMDNCSVHRIQEIREVVNAAGVLIFYLPPYSPDYNPIELTFSYIKCFLKDHEDIIHTISPHLLHLIASHQNCVIDGFNTVDIK